jgi:hypothetical protein
VIPLDPQIKMAIDGTLARLRRKRFPLDPAVPPRYARAASIVASAYKRHGLILQLALVRALVSDPKLAVWSDVPFFITSAADHVCQVSADDSVAQSSLAYQPEAGRPIRLDIVVLRSDIGLLSSYEIKRGNGPSDAGKTRQIKRDLICTQLLLRNYGMRLGYAVNSAEAHLISYYGRGHIKPPWSIEREALDEHFGCDVVQPIEQATDYFRFRLEAMLDDWRDEPERQQLELFIAETLI